MVRQALEVNLLRFEICHQIHQPFHAASQAIKLPDHKSIPGAKMGKRLFEAGTIGTAATGLVSEEPITSASFKGVSLKGKVLVLGGDAGVPDAHGFPFLETHIKDMESRELNQEWFSRIKAS